MKYLTLTIIAIFAATIPFAYAETMKEKKSFKLIDAFREMASGVKKIFAPKVKPVKSVIVTQSYDVRQHSIINDNRLNVLLGGVLKGKGQKFIDEARKNDLCPIFFAAICMHESANGTSKFSREKNNVFGIFKNGKYHTFENVDECIEYTAKLLGKSKLYAGGKNFTIVGIQRVYCPVGAANDPKSLNKFWLQGVIDKMVKIWGREVLVTA